MLEIWSGGVLFIILFLLLAMSILIILFLSLSTSRKEERIRERIRQEWVLSSHQPIRRRLIAVIPMIGVAILWLTTHIFPLSVGFLLVLSLLAIVWAFWCSRK